MGLKFKRQHPIGPYVADFVCIGLKLIVEADGGQHGQVDDIQRDAWLRANGFSVLRFWNNEVLGQMEAVLERIRVMALELGHVEVQALSPCPSPASGRGEQTARTLGGLANPSKSRP